MYINSKLVTFRKLAHMKYRVRTPEGQQTFENNRAAKSYFREMIKKFGQVFIPKPERAKLSFERIMEMTSVRREKQ